MKSHFVCYVTGGIRSGKGLFAVRTIEDFALRKCRIVTNYDLWLENFLPHNLKDVQITRIPDRPTVEDLEAIGFGYDHDDPLHYDEERFGLIVLDELGTWLNSRSWNQKGRQGVIDWLLHSGKRRWSLMLTIQDIDMLDKQAKDATASQFIAYCKKLGDYPIPFVTSFLRLFGFNVTLPDIRLATIRLGADPRGWVSDRVFYTGRKYYRAYNTRQEFYARDSPHCSMMYSYLSPWHLKGRYIKKRTLKDMLLWLNARPYLLLIPLSFLTLLSAVTFASAFYTYQVTNDELTKMAASMISIDDKIKAVQTQPSPDKKSLDIAQIDCSDFDYLKQYRINGFSEYPLHHAGSVYDDIRKTTYSFINSAGDRSITTSRLIGAGFEVVSQGRCSVLLKHNSGCRIELNCEVQVKTARGGGVANDAPARVPDVKQQIEKPSQGGGFISKILG